MKVKNKQELMMRIAVVGAGIAGLSCAYRLTQAGHIVSLFEANDYFGGHTHTVDITLEGITHGVDTGFLVFNHQTYPELTRLFAELGIDTSPAEMSFSVRLRDGARLLEWAGANLNSVFTQRRNLFDWRFLRMLKDIVRFNRQCSALVDALDPASAQLSLGEFLELHRYGAEFRDWYLLPMAGSIWSCPSKQMLAFPLASMIRFCHNHGLLQISNRPQWYSVRGGARQYVEKIMATIPERYLSAPVLKVRRYPKGVEINTAKRSIMFDHVVLACHSDQSLALLSDASSLEQEILGAITYQPNHAILHTDHTSLPTQRRAWSAWNYHSDNGREPKICVHYLLNQLQALPWSQAVIVSLNPIHRPAAQSILGEFDYAHPLFDAAALAAQQRLNQIQGLQHTWFAGAWTGYGFHEDGLRSGLNVAQALLENPDFN